MTPAFLPHSPALARALQLAAQALSAAAVTAASAHARLLVLAGLTATCIAHSNHSQVKFLLKQGRYCKQTVDGSCT